MKIRRVSPDAERLTAIVEMARALEEKKDRKKYSLGIEFALAELVRSEMRRIAQDEPTNFGNRDILEKATDRALEQVHEALHRKQVNIDLQKYASTVREKLKFPAKEMQQLSNNLVQSRRIQKLGAKEELAADSGIHCIIHELGLREAIQGLLAEPIGDTRDLNIDGLREQREWRLNGDWFPFELLVEQFVFVIDDDGSVFVSTANLPIDLKDHAGALLRRVIDRLYAYA